MDCIAEYDYSATHADELSLKKGDIIKSVIFFETGWKKGWLNGKEGVFPDNFVKVIKTDFKNTSNKENGTNPNVEDNLNTKTKLKTHSSDQKTKTTKEKSHINNSLNVEPLIVEAIFSYKAENPDEITIEVGDIIKVLNKNLIDDGWWKGIKRTGEIGIFPSNFVQPFSENGSPLSFKKKSSNDSDLSIKNVEKYSLNENSIPSPSVSFNDLSNGKMKHFSTNSYLINNSKVLKATKNINVSSTSIDSGKDLKVAQCFQDCSKEDKSTNKSKDQQQDVTQKPGNDIPITKSEFLAFKKEVEQNIGKLSLRILTLIDEIDEEKKQRAASEIELVRIRRVVHMLDAQILNGFNH